MTSGTLVHRGTAGDIAWESATRPPAAALGAHVRRLQGYDERTRGPLLRPELPGTSVVLILELGPPIAIQPHGEPEAVRRFGGFVAGLGKHPVLTTHDGWQRGVQLDLPATSARRLLGIPMLELRGAGLALQELLRPNERSLPERLEALPTWDARLACVERWLQARLTVGPPPDRRVGWAVQQIERHGGNVDVGSLRRALQLSERHLVALFREHVGVPPKLYGRLVRFERLRQRLRSGPPKPWARHAAELGYCDQAHLARDVRALAAMTPTELAAFLGAASTVGPWPEELVPLGSPSAAAPVG